MTFVVTHVRHALQHAVATGACSPYFAAARAARPTQICFTVQSVASPALAEGGFLV